MTKMTLPVAQMPAVISESVATTLRAHGLTLSPEMLRELGNNTSQALFSLDVAAFAADEPSVADRLAVGETLRAHAAAGRPNPETAAAIARVGDWLVDVARVELAQQRRAHADTLAPAEGLRA